MDLIVNANLFRHSTKILDRSIPITPFHDHVMSKPLCPIDVPVSTPFVRTAPEKKGIPLFVIRDFLYEAFKVKKIPLHGITVIKDGAVICDVDASGYSSKIYHACHSLSKSVTATAIGMLIDEGKLSLNDKVVKILEKKIPAIYTLAYRNLTIKHLLTMTSGASFSELGIAVEKNWLSAYFGSRMTFEAGKKFHYNSLNTYVLSVIVKEVSGKGLVDYLKPRLFDPLGIDLYHWELSPEGIEAGGWGLYLRREDAAKIGQLYLDNGVWNGRRIVSEGWVKRATRAAVRTPKETGDLDYGFHFWADKEGNRFLLNGMFCQDVYVIRDKRIVIACNGAVEQLFQQSEYYNLIEKHFISDYLYPRHEVNIKALVREISSDRKDMLSFIRRLPKEISSVVDVSFVAEHTDKTAFKGAHRVGNCHSYGILPLYEQMLRNYYSGGIRSITLRKDSKKIYLDVLEEDGNKRLPLSLDGTSRNTVLKFGTTEYRTSIRSKLTRDEYDNPVIRIRIDFPEISSSRYIKLYFKDGGLLVRMNEMPGMGLIRLFASEIENGIKKNKVISDMISLLDADSVFLKLEKRVEPAFFLVPDYSEIVKH